MSRSASRGNSRRGKKGQKSSDGVQEPRLDMDDLESESGTPREHEEYAPLHLPTAEEEDKTPKLKTRMELDIEAAESKAIADAEAADAAKAARLAALPKTKEEKIYRKFNRIYGPPKKKSHAPKVIQSLWIMIRLYLFLLPLPMTFIFFIRINNLPRFFLLRESCDKFSHSYPFISAIPISLQLLYQCDFLGYQRYRIIWR